MSREEVGSAYPVIPTEQDLAFLQVLFDHGHTATDMLHARLRPGKGQAYTTNRLMILQRRPNQYVYRHAAQHFRRLSHARFLFHDVTDKGVGLLVEHGLVTPEHAAWRQRLRGRGNAKEFFHEALAAHVTNSIALGAGPTFLSAWHATAKAPESARSSRRPLTIEKLRFTPDDFLALRYPAGFRFFAVEADMGTVPSTRRGMGSSAFRKFKLYGEVLESRAYSEHYGIPSLLVLVVTVSQRHMHSMMRALADAAGGKYWRRAFLFQHTGDPREQGLPATDYLYRQPWETLDGRFDISSS